MDKTFVLFVVVGIGFIYFITSFIGEIQKEDDKFSNTEYALKHKYDKYYSLDSVGRDILIFADADEKIQIEAWQHSKLKKEFLKLFPDFGEMKRFANERIRGDLFQTKLLNVINETEGQFFEGTLNAEQAKQKLDLLK
ncbi:MAG TPA: hypothetical protein CFH81_07000 [Sulfurovum sp. UBA12169]|nr:MAG TPA: hypothetical protein CFH81_07000 [Sulfurovum sp. UBA12169]